MISFFYLIFKVKLDLILNLFINVFEFYVISNSVGNGINLISSGSGGSFSIGGGGGGSFSIGGGGGSFIIGGGGESFSIGGGGGSLGFGGGGGKFGICFFYNCICYINMVYIRKKL